MDRKVPALLVVVAEQYGDVRVYGPFTSWDDARDFVKRRRVGEIYTLTPVASERYGGRT